MISFLLSMLPAAKEQVDAIYHLLAADIWKSMRKTALTRVIEVIIHSGDVASTQKKRK